MIKSVNKLELSDKKYLANGNVIEKNYKGNFLFPMKEFVSFRTDLQSMYFMPIRFLKDKIDGVCIPKISTILNLRHNLPFTYYLVKLCREVQYMWWGNQEL